MVAAVIAVTYAMSLSIISGRLVLSLFGFNYKNDLLAAMLGLFCVWAALQILGQVQMNTRYIYILIYMFSVRFLRRKL